MQTDGFWFFPESKVRGASEFEVGAQQVCPQGTPITFIGNNEAHNNGKYGLRIFTGKNHNGEGLPGFYPRKMNPCAPVSESNPFEPSEFSNFFSWRNGHNGITFGSVAGLRIVDAVVADNLMRGIEGTGADGIASSLSDTMTQLRGPWGSNMIVRPIFIGHAQDGCPACNHLEVPVYPASGGPVGYGGAIRLGICTPAAWGLTVENATFINYDREGMAAVGGFSKAVPPGAGYNFIGNGGFETKFSGTRWVQSQYRARWRWQSEVLITDVDGTFSDQSFCAGCHVLKSNLLASSDAFPDCYIDTRYDGSVCKPNYHFVAAGFSAKPPCGPCENPPIRISYRNEEGIYVRADDARYLKHKWRPEGKFSLVRFDISSDKPYLTIVGEHDENFWGSWHTAQGEWMSRRRLRFNFRYQDQFDKRDKYALNYEAVISEDGTMLSFQDNTATMRISEAEIRKRRAAAALLFASSKLDNISYGLRLQAIDLMAQSRAVNGSQTPQLFTDVVWYRCELLPHMCAGSGIRYPNQAGAEIGRERGSFQIQGNLLCVTIALELKLPACLTMTTRRRCSPMAAASYILAAAYFTYHHQPARHLFTAAASHA